jgi:hypothetical protein
MKYERKRSKDKFDAIKAELFPLGMKNSSTTVQSESPFLSHLSTSPTFWALYLWISAI